MALDNLKHLILDYAKDQRRNLDALINSSVLMQQQLWGLLACLCRDVAQRCGFKTGPR